MARYLLVHGSCHGAWCWRDVIPELEALGHEATAIDLPSHGSDRTPAKDVTLPMYAEAILAALETPAIVVGHSMAGYPITQAAADRPEVFQRLVYLAAHVPSPGLGLTDMRAIATADALREAIRPSADGVTITFEPSHVEALFYHDCPPGTVEYALEHLTPQPLKPQQTAVENLANASAVQADYIVCSEDRAVPTAYQRNLAAKFPEAHRHEMRSSHSPFFSDPKGLATLLSQMA